MGEASFLAASGLVAALLKFPQALFLPVGNPLPTENLSKDFPL
jgi:hypothetical protein